MSNTYSNMSTVLCVASLLALHIQLQFSFAAFILWYKPMQLPMCLNTNWRWINFHPKKTHWPFCLEVHVNTFQLVLQITKHTVWVSELWCFCHYFRTDYNLFVHRMSLMKCTRQEINQVPEIWLERLMHVIGAYLSFWWL